MEEENIIDRGPTCCCNELVPIEGCAVPSDMVEYVSTCNGQVPRVCPAEGGGEGEKRERGRGGGRGGEETTVKMTLIYTRGTFAVC